MFRSKSFEEYAATRASADSNPSEACEASEGGSLLRPTATRTSSGATIEDASNLCCDHA
jgi:hypothetical protein